MIVYDCRLQDPQVFSLIQRYGLYEEIESCIEDLMHLNVSEAINLFMKHKERLTPSIVISRLEGNRYYQYLVIQRNTKLQVTKFTKYELYFMGNITL